MMSLFDLTGLVRTDFAKAIWSGLTVCARAKAQSPLGRIGEPDDVAGVAVFLALIRARTWQGRQLVIDRDRLAMGRGRTLALSPHDAAGDQAGRSGKVILVPILPNRRFNEDALARHLEAVPASAV